MTQLLDRPVPTVAGRRRPVATAVLAGTVALLVQATAYALGWSGHDRPALVAWYAGLVLLVAVFAPVLTARGLTGTQRLVGSLGLTLLLHASYLLSNPVLATRFDESLHVTTLLGLTGGDGWFAPNPMLPVSPHYPGLELATAGVQWLTGLPLMACQVLVVLLARAAFVVALFLLASRVGHSTRVGSTVVLLYAATSQFYFFNAQYSYQTVAVTLLAVAAHLLLRAYDDAARWPWLPLAGAQVCLAALTVTHHLTSWLALLGLAALAALHVAAREGRRARLAGVTVAAAAVVTAAWTAVVAPLLASYLGPVFGTAGEEVRSLLALDTGRQLLADGGGDPAPVWQVGVMAAAILLWCVLLVPAGLAGLRGRTLRRTPVRLLPLGLAAVYPLLPLARFSPTASEVADRASTFVGLALALVVGLWVASRTVQLRGLVTAGAVVLVLGGTILGSGPDWQRVPGPYVAGAEQRSVDSAVVAAGEWAGTYLPAGSRIASDTTLDRVLPNFAPVVPVTEGSGSVNTTPIFAARWITDAELALIREGEIDFVVVDTRIAGQTVRSGDFFEAGSSFGPGAVTVDPVSIAKFSITRGFDLVLDGPVRIYDVRALRGEPQTWADREPAGLPGGWTPWQALLSAALALVGVTLLVRRRTGLLPLLLALPALMVLGAIGVTIGLPAMAGTLVLLAAVLVVSGLPPRGAPVPRVPWQALVAAAVLIAATGLATHAAWDAQLPDTALPAPSPGGAR